MRRILLAVVALVGFLRADLPCPAAEGGLIAVGAARQEITPRGPIRLSGFGFRRAESEGVAQRLWAKALALGDQDPAVLIAVDNLGVSQEIVREVARRLAKHGVKPERLAVTATHTHSGPMLRGVCPTLFGVPIPEAHQKHIDTYTDLFLDGLEKAAVAALADRRPARVSWGVGRVGFARNRRTAGGPVDHDLTLLAVHEPAGKLRAVHVSYACHCVTLSFNKVHGDWAGCAQEAIEDLFPGVTAVVSVGCGADSNPASGVTGDKVEVATRQGAEVAAEVKRLLGGAMTPVRGAVAARRRVEELPLADLPDRAGWEERARRNDAIGHHARVQLGKLDRGEKLPAKIDYAVTAWTFGTDLALVFLPGEVVVDYANRLKRELDGARVGIVAYSNDSPGYVPSERVLKEGGYEGGGAMVYYDIPAAYRTGLEEKIVGAVHEVVGAGFRAGYDPNRTGGTRPLPPRRSEGEIRVRAGLAAELVACEPLVTSPVAIDFGPDGRVWVAEMVDYPAGVKGDYRPGGRVRVLEDTDGDGKFDRATVFLDGIPFPTGVLVWRDGVLVCAAPDILFARDTDGDGKADRVEKLFSGFGTSNYQGRVNSLQLGLDGWVHGSCGLFGGTITSPKTGRKLALGDRDFRIQPDTGAIEAATGRTQQGRVRDDWGNWFGCDNSTLARHYVVQDHDLRRNPHAAYPDPSHFVPAGPDPGRLYPARPDVQLFKLSGPVGRVTAACGIGVYRDDLLGVEYRGDLFTCEPVSLVVHREKLTPEGSTFAGRRAAGEEQLEFLASTDEWFRPVQVRTGPDGALWVVDMSRYVIEHPRWIPPEELAKVDVRAGANQGRIYRIRPEGKPLRAAPRLDRMSATELAAALDTPNGTVRDLATAMLVWQGGRAAVPVLADMAVKAGRAEARLNALAALEGLHALTVEPVRAALGDRHAGVRRLGARLVGERVGGEPSLGEPLAALVRDPDAQVRLEAAVALGYWRDRRAGEALAELALAHGEDPYLRAAVLSSIGPHNLGTVLRQLGEQKGAVGGPLLEALLSQAVAVGDGKALGETLGQVLPREGEPLTARGLVLAAAVLEACARRGKSLQEAAGGEAAGRVERLGRQARAALGREATDPGVRRMGLMLVGQSAGADDLPLLVGHLTARHSGEVQEAALAALGHVRDARAAGAVLAGWATYAPGMKGRVLDAALGEPAWTGELLERMERGQVPAGQVDAGRRQRLLTHKDARVRARAAKLLAGDATSRAEVVTRYADVVGMKGDEAKGKAVFARACATCHRLDGAGHEVGPGLESLGSKSPAAVLVEILDPNRNVDPRYTEYAATTRAGKTVTGVLAAETGTSITLRGQEGKEVVLLRSEVEELSGSGKSLMPEGLEKDLTKGDLADLLAYLGQTRVAPKAFAGNAPGVVQFKGGRGTLTAARAEIYGPSLVFEEPFGNLGMWHAADDHAAWRVEVGRTGTFDVWLEWACANESAGNPWRLEGSKSVVRGRGAATGGWDKYRKEKVGTISLAAGAGRVILGPEGPPRGALMDLRAIFLVPVGERP